MRNVSKVKIKMICDADYEVFEFMFNKAMDKLSDCNPTSSEVSFSESKGFWASIKYIEEFDEPETVRDEFRLEGIRFTCQNCPLHEDTADKRKKWVSCKYKDNGIAHLEHECCEYFYKLLKQNRVKPI